MAVSYTHLDVYKRQLEVFLITLALAVPLGLGLALLRISRFAVLSTLVNGYIWLCLLYTSRCV